MKLLEAGAKKFIFLMAPREKEALLHLLSTYPKVPAGHHHASRETGKQANTESEALINEALSARRQENKTILNGFLADRGRFTVHGEACQFALTPPEAEWLLEVLNDIRVGSWTELGCPEQIHWPEPMTAESARAFASMEAAGYFQAGLLEALQRPSS